MYYRDEELQKLCFYAKIRADLAYINYDYVPSWKEYVYESTSDPFHCVLYCPTLPTVYLFRKTHSSYMMITFLQSRVEHFKFDGKFIEASSVSLSKFLISPSFLYIDLKAFSLFPLTVLLLISGVLKLIRLLFRTRRRSLERIENESV